MAFDANLVLADSTAEWTYSNLNSYGSPDDTTKNAGGFVVLDIKETGAQGISVALIIDEAGAAADDALTVKLQASDNKAFGSEVHTLALFEVAAATEGVITGAECPCTVIRRIVTEKRYLRIAASCVASDDFHTVWVVASPYPFKTL